MRGHHSLGTRRRTNAPQARVVLLDVKNPAIPRMDREFYIDGGLVESRMIGSRLYLATNSPAKTTRGICQASNSARREPLINPEERVSGDSAFKIWLVIS